MKRISRLLYEVCSGRIPLMVLAILFTLCAGQAISAPDSRSVTIVLQSEPDSVDPGNTVRILVGQVIMKNVLETLTEMNHADSSIAPRLATSWKQIDPNTWHFFLRKDVKFHDGADFNADAVVFNFKRIYDKRINSRTRNKFFTNVKVEGRALDSHTLEVKTDKFEPLVPTLMANLALCSPNTPLDKWTRSPIGTGPYRFAKWDAGMQIVLERFDGYWGKKPQVEKAVYVWRTESSVQAAMVLNGEADLALNIAKEDANRPDMDFSYLNSETVRLRIGGTWEPPLNDRRVRMALNYAIDRNAIRGSILSKDVILATQLVMPSIFGHNPDLKPWPYDPQKAKQLLAEAKKDGVPVDKEITIVGQIGQYPGSGEVMEALLAMYKAVGLNVKFKVMESGVFLTYRDRPFPTNVGPYLVHTSHDNSTGDAAFTVFGMYHCNVSLSVVCDEKLDDLIGKAQVAAGEERRKLWQAAFKRIHEEIISDVFLFHMIGFTRVGKRINFKPSLAINSECQLAQITFK
jgi:peptide/nickel transport system substrate-binding protein